MRPVLIERGSFRIWSYPALLYAGLVCGIAVENYAAHAARMDALRVWVATLLLLPCALIGARLLFVMSHWSIYRCDARRIWDRSEGGLAMYGAVPAMLLVSVPVLAIIGLPFWAFWDVSVFCILVGMIFARVGCLMYGCCCGRITTGAFGLSLRDQHGLRARRIPTQLLEAGLGVLLLAGAALTWPRPDFHGELFLSSLTLYAVGRFALQGMRAERRLLGPFDLQQVISAAAAALGAATLLVMGT